MKIIRAFFMTALLSGIAMPAQSLFADSSVTIQPQDSSAKKASPIALSNHDDSYFYLEAGPAYARTTVAGSSANLYGAAISIGWCFDQTNKIHLDFDYLQRSTSESVFYGYYDYDPNTGAPSYITGIGTRKVKNKITPLLLSYSACIPLNGSASLELRITPSVGYFRMTEDVSEARIYDTNGDEKDAYPGYSDTHHAIAYGLGLGISYHINKKFYIDAGYRFLRAKVNEADAAAINMHTLTATFGWKF